MSLRLSYGTNGFSDHRLHDAIDIIAELGYVGVALTLDHHHLDPFSESIHSDAAAVRRQLTELGLGVAVETGARYLLDPRKKHEPTLISTEGRDIRLDFLRRAIDIAADLGSDVVHLWSGVLPTDTTIDIGWERLLDGVSRILPYAEAADVDLAFEPEPGMLIERLADVQELRRRLNNPARLRFTIDVGHAVCNEDDSPADVILASANHLVHVQIEDMRRGVHEHLPFGEGELDLTAAIGALLEIDYRGLVSVELGRHGPTAPATAAASIHALQMAVAAAKTQRQRLPGRL